ncbi:MAG: hypothetical protein ACREVB_01270, partial [Burkholderiales bacterium]
MGMAGCILGAAIGYAIAQPSFSALVSGSTSPDRAADQVRKALAETDPLSRTSKLADLLAGLGPGALPAVTAVFDAAPLNRGDVELALLGSWWGSFDPEAAWQWAKSDWRAAHTTVMTAIARAWAHRDPAAAIEHASGLQFRGQARMAVAAAMAGWEESGKPGLLDYVQGVGDPVTQQKLAETLAERKVMELGAEPALTWAETLPHQFAAIMRPRVASAVAEMEPKVVAAWAEPRIAAAASSDGRPTGLPRRIATRWVKYDPDAAMAWLASLPAGRDRDDGVTETIRTWARREPIRARLWIERQELETWNEPIFAYYARSIIGATEPQRALELVARFR